MVGDNKVLSVVCVGFNLESLYCLQGFKDNNIHISGVVTLPFQEQKRASDYRDLIPFCKQNEISYYISKDINSNETKAWLREINPDVIFILGWSQIFDEELIELPKKYIIGSHPSDLPYGAGRAPIVWTILEDLRKSAVSFFKINKSVDAGDIVFKKHFLIPQRTDATFLYHLVAKKLSEGFVEVYNQIQNNTLSEEKQDIAQRTLRSKRVYADGQIYFNRTADEIDRLIRATTDPYPGAFAYYKGVKYSIWKSELSEVISKSRNLGEILDIKRDGILVQCYQSTLWLFDITNSSEKIISIKKFEIGQQFDLVLQNT